MLKIMQGNRFFTMFILSVITVMITVAFVFWGIGPKDRSSVAVVAQIEGKKITLDEFWRAYDNEYKRIKEQYPDPEEIKKLKLEDRVLGYLVDRSVILIAAQRAGISISEQELQDAIINTPYFQKDGVFDQEVYQRALKLNRLSPQIYEDSLKSDLTIAKMSRLIGETTELSPEELKIIESFSGGNKEQLTEIFRSNKNNQAIKAYVEGIKRSITIKINRELIS